MVINPSYTTEVEEIQLDAVSALALVSFALTERATERLHAAGFEDLRPADGRLFGRLQHGPRTVTELARDLEVTPQAISKTLGPLVEAGYLTLERAPDDGRARIVSLADRGRSAIAAARQARADVVADLDARLDGRVGALLPTLLDVIAELDIPVDRRTFRA